jgi:2-phosphosulfolactate phosphatase
VVAAGGAAAARPVAGRATAAFRAVADRLAAALPTCASGRELVEDGFAADVELAAAYDVSTVVPVLYGDAFVDATS